MSPQELEKRLSKIQDEKLADEVRHFLSNLYVLFDGQPPSHIKHCVNDILDLLEEKELTRRIFF